MVRYSSPIWILKTRARKSSNALSDTVCSHTCSCWMHDGNVLNQWLGFVSADELTAAFQEAGIEN